jgi:anti-sigma B factor antagonist
VLKIAINEDKKRKKLTAERNLLFERFSRNPLDIRLAIEIKLIDDQVAECTNQISRKRDTPREAGLPIRKVVRSLQISQEVAMKMTTSIRQVDGVTVVDMSGRLELGQESAALRDLIFGLLKNGHKQILLNLGDVHYIDSAGLGTLVGALTTVRKQEGELKLLNLTNKVGDLMQITKLYIVFDIMNDESVAVRSFSQSTAAIA